MNFTTTEGHPMTPRRRKPGINHSAAPATQGATLFDYAQRNAILAAHEEKNPTFCERAREFVLAYLREHGPTNSEQLTDACMAAGIAPETTTKAFGAVYASLSRRGLIVSCGLAPRIRGHGSIGAHVWTLTQPEI